MGDHPTSFLGAVCPLLSHDLPAINGGASRHADAPGMLNFSEPVSLLGDAPSMLGFADLVPLLGDAPAFLALPIRSLWSK